MKNMKNEGSFATARLQAKMRSILAIALVAVTAFSMAACKDDGGDDSGGGKHWLRTKQTTYALGGTGSSTETYYYWLKYSYKNETDYEEEYETDSTFYRYRRDPRMGLTSTSYNLNFTDDYTDSFSESGWSTITTDDSESGLALKSRTSHGGGTKETVISYSVMLLSDNGGVKTYRQYMISYTIVDYNQGISISQDISTQGYSEYKIQNGRTLERKDFSADGMLISITTYTLSDNAVIRSKLRNYTLYNTQSSTYNAYNTVEVISNSDSALVLQERTFVNNALSSQTESVYEKINFGSSSGFTYAEQNTITITGYEGSGGNITIPAQINKKPVTRIGIFAFYGYTSLTSVTIPNSVTSIGAGAFKDRTSLSSVTIPSGTIGNSAFSSCKSLTSITIGNSVTSIGNNAFSYCSSISSVTIGNSVTRIGHNAFGSCTSLASVTIGNSVTSIGESAFYGCTSLTSVTIGNGVTSIGMHAFYIDSLTRVTFEGTIDADNLGRDDVDGFWRSPFCGDLREKYLAGGPGTYTTTTPVPADHWNWTEWTKQE